MTLLIRGAQLVDGTGAEAREADVLLANGVVAAVGDRGSLHAGDADRTVDADGLVLAPGFIDVHSHADSAPFLDQVDVSKISQGVTSEVIGNCGLSLAPCPPGRRAEISELIGRLFPSLPFDWDTVAALYDRTDAAGYTVNTVPLVGHHTLRAAAMGVDDREPTPAELQHMRNGLAAALDAGAFGLSSGLIYPPGMFSSTDELVTLARDLPPGRVYATHMRGEGLQLPASVDEAIAVAERAGCRLQVSHLKAAGHDAWGTVREALTRLDRAHDQGTVSHHDVYPYEANSTMLTSCLPPWFQDGGNAGLMQRLRDPDALRRAEQELQHNDGTWENWVAGSGWSNVLLASTANHANEGLTLDHVAELRGGTPFEALVDVLIENELTATMSVFAMCAEDVEAVLAHPRALIGSDGTPPGTGGKPHPRLYGTFTRVLARHVRESSLLTLPEAVAKMTSRPAAAFGIADRGTVRVGAAADIVLFDPDVVADRATFVDPVRLSAGIELVVVNGTVGFEQGASTGVRAGRRLRPPDSPAVDAPGPASGSRQ